MRNSARVSIKGTEQTIRVLNMVRSSVLKRVEAAVVESARAVQRGAKDRVPVRTGVLKKSIRVSLKKERLLAEVGPRWKGRVHPLAHLVEFGHLARNGRFVAARPFLLPAWEGERAHFEKRIKEAVRGGVEAK